ncbi:hypothetical protein Avbf_06210 [Armadillidium vulgare]|nr:hypothetical protein Avbf_06210 [Armadillidium vulgare]
MRLKYCALFCFLFVTLENGESYKGLFIMTLGTKSHLNFFQPIIESLARAGHDMTLLTSREAKFEEKSVKQIVVYDENIENVMGNLFNISTIDLFRRSIEILPKICLNSLQTLIDIENNKTETNNYDFIILSIVNSECFFGYLYESKVPFMYAFPNALMTPHGMRMGEPEFPSVNPNLLTSLNYPMSFTERILNIFVDIIYTLYAKYYASK